MKREAVGIWLRHQSKFKQNYLNAAFLNPTFSVNAWCQHLLNSLFFPSPKLSVYWLFLNETMHSRAGTWTWTGGLLPFLANLAVVIETSKLAVLSERGLRRCGVAPTSGGQGTKVLKRSR